MNDARAKEMQEVERALKAKLDQHYELGWNAGLEMVAFKLVHDFRQAFGEDTLASIAAWIKEQKK